MGTDRKRYLQNAIGSLIFLRRSRTDYDTLCQQCEEREVQDDQRRIT